MVSENEDKIEEERRQASIDRVGILNEKRQQALINQEEEKQAKIKEEQKTFQDMQPNAVNKATSNLLKAAWENLIDSFGTTLLWIDIHIFGGMVMGNKLFCKLGMEWVPDILKQTRSKEAEKMGDKIGVIEGIGVAGLNLGCIFAVIAGFMVIGVMFKVVTNPIEALAGVTGYIWDKVSGLVK